MTPTRGGHDCSRLTVQSSITVLANSDSAISARVSSSMLSSTSSSNRLPCRTSEIPADAETAQRADDRLALRVENLGLRHDVHNHPRHGDHSTGGNAGTASPARPEVRVAQRRRHRVEDLRVGDDRPVHLRRQRRPHGQLDDGAAVRIGQQVLVHDLIARVADHGGDAPSARLVVIDGEA